MSEIAVRERLQEIHRGIDGVTSAPCHMPGEPNTDDLPCVLCYAEAADWMVPWYSGKRGDREWKVVLYVRPVGLEDFGICYEDTLPFLDRFSDAYHLTTNIAVADEEWRELALVNDSGVRSDIKLHGVGEQLYWGIVFTLNVKRKEGVA